jgi:hypothetical protein
LLVNEQRKCNAGFLSKHPRVMAVAQADSRE